MVRAAYCVPLGNAELIPGQKSDRGRSCRIREREAPLVVANSRVVVTGRVVGNPETGDKTSFEEHQSCEVGFGGSDSGLLLVDGQIGSHRFVRRNWYR